MGVCLAVDVEESRGMSREREENFVEHLRGLLGSELRRGVVSRGEPFWKRARRTLSSSKRHIEPKWSRGGNWRATSDAQSRAVQQQAPLPGGAPPPRQYPALRQGGQAPMAARTKCMTSGGRRAAGGRRQGVWQPHQHRQRHQHCGSCRLRATYAGAREETSMCLGMRLCTPSIAEAAVVTVPATVIATVTATALTATTWHTAPS